MRARSAGRVVRAGGPILGALVACTVLGLPGSAAVAPSPALSSVVIRDLGPGYSVASEGPLDASGFASDSPDPAAASGALATLAKTIGTYERVWKDRSGFNEVQDLLVRFPSVVGAQVFLQAAEHSLETGEIVSSGSLPDVPGARRTTYFASTTQAGVGQAITMRAGVYVDLLSFFSAASANAQPITPADGVVVARAQHAAMVAAPGGTAGTPSAGAGTSLTAGSIGLAAVAVAVIAAAVATPAFLRRRHAHAERGADEGTLGDAPTGAG